MKIFWLLLATATAGALNAQTNLPAPGFSAATNAAAPSTNAPAKERPPIEIKSEHGVFDLKNRSAVYTDNVRVTDPQMKLICDVLTATMPTNSTRIESIIAEGNVKIEGKDDKNRPVHAKSDKAIYSYKVLNSVTNETITLTGNVFVDSATFKGTAEPIIWDRIKDIVYLEKQTMLIQMPTNTNASAAPKPVEK